MRFEYFASRIRLGGHDLPVIEVENPSHPYGVRGVGEVPIVPPLAAVCNAVSRAAGKRLYDLPLRPDRVWAELNA